MKKESFLTLRIPTEMRGQLQITAQEQDLPIGWIVRKAIANYLKQNSSSEEKKSVESRKGKLKRKAISQKETLQKN